MVEIRNGEKENLRIYILFRFVENAWGGGNQFLKAIREYFKKNHVYSDELEDADVVIFNSYPFGSEYLFKEIFNIKKRNPNVILIHRVDGPIFLVRGKDRAVDEIIFQFNNFLADGTIFQSKWSEEKNHGMGLKKSRYEAIIMNAPNSSVFNPEGKKPFNRNRVKLIATSWSNNPRKGFDIYKYLDGHLDFNRYEMTFVGNSPINFKNVKWIKPIPSEKLAQILRQHDIYITGSRNDPCSNALIEALSCGLPAVVLNNGGHPELVRKGGESFNGREDVIEKLESIVKNYHYYQSQIPKFSIQRVAQQYYEFAEKIYEDVANGRYNPKSVKFSTIVNFYKMKFIIRKWDKTSKNKGIKNRIRGKIIWRK